MNNVCKTCRIYNEQANWNEEWGVCKRSHEWETGVNPLNKVVGVAAEAEDGARIDRAARVAAREKRRRRAVLAWPIGADTF